MSSKFLITILILSILKLWLVVLQPVLGIHPSGYDDRLFLKLAEFLYNGEWLGPYDQLTLIKGPIYPMWLALSYTSGLPLHFTQQLLYLFAGLMLLMALKKLGINSLVLVILYLLYLFNPMTETYVTRASIYPALAVLVIAGLIGLYASKNSHLFKFGLWASLLGIALSALWLTREEGIWLIPTTLLIIGYLIVTLYRTEQFLGRTLISLLPLLILFGSIQFIAFINKTYYNVYFTVEFQSPAFSSAYGALPRVKDEEWQPFIPILKKTHHKIYAVSPAFKELEPFLEGHIGQIWEKGGRRFILRDNVMPQNWTERNRHEIIGSIFIFALRDAVVLAGYHVSAAKADNYYRRLAREIEQACEQQLLDCFPLKATVMPVYRMEYLPLTVRAYLFMANSVIGFQHLPQYTPKHNVACQLAPFVIETVTGRFIQRACDLPTLSIGTKVLHFETLAAWQQTLQNNMVTIYQTLMPPLFYLALLAYVFTWFHLFRFRQLSFLFVLNTAVFGAILIRLLIFAIVDSTFFPLINFNSGNVAPSMTRYLLPVFPLLLMFSVLALTDSIQRGIKKKVKLI